MHGDILTYLEPHVALSSSNDFLINSTMRDKQDLSIRAAIQDIAVGPDRGRDIGEDHAEEVMRQILDGNESNVQSAIFLIALRMKRESVPEFAGLFRALSSESHVTKVNGKRLLCMVDPFDGYLRNNPVSPFIPAVLAALGIPAYIHGVNSVGPKHGVTCLKVFELAGLSCTARDHQSDVDVAGWTFANQADYAPKLYALLDLREQLVKRTAVTTLERLLMPIQGEFGTDLALGYVHKAYPEIYAKMAKQAGFKTVTLLKGVEGGLSPALNKPMRRFIFEDDLPEQIDEEKAVFEHPFQATSKSAGNAMLDSQDMVEQCLEQGLATLAGKPGVARDSLCLSAANLLQARSAELSMSDAVEKVQCCLDNGLALDRFHALSA